MMSRSQNAALLQHRRRKSSASFDIDDEDRAYFYHQHGRRPSLSAAGHFFRRRRFVPWLLIGVSLFLAVILLSGRREKSVDWSRYGYSLYATDVQSLCNAYMVFESLKRYRSKADRLLHYPRQWDTHVDSNMDRSSDLLVRMRDKLKVKLLPAELIGANGPVEPGGLNTEASWDASITKLLAFKLTTYSRILHLDSDITLLNHMDELFLLPETPVAMPRAYWSEVPESSVDGVSAWPLTSLLVLLQPSAKEFKYLMDTLQTWRQAPGFEHHKKYDMDLLNHRYGSSAMVLPHRPYAMLSSEFRSTNHSAYLGEPLSIAQWNPDKALREAKLVHFSDWPLPKPWIMWPVDALYEMQPRCDGDSGCRDRVIWKELYDDFRRRRKVHCQLLSVPPTTWSAWKALHGVKNATETEASAAQVSDSIDEYSG